MKIQYFEDTDTLYVLLSDKEIYETKDLDENTIIELDQHGKLVGITIEHAKERADLANFSYQQVAVQKAAWGSAKTQGFAS
ncbi:MAG: DUF2283 domain-containing protein [bacterium]